MPLLNDADAIYLGGEPVDRIYLGDTQVWPSASWLPSDLAGLTAWFDASQLALADAAPVTSWPDLTANARHLTPVRGTAPTFRTNVLNGKPVVRFSRSLGNALSSSASSWSYNHFFIVAKYALAYFADYDGLLGPGAGGDDLALIGSGAGSYFWYTPGGSGWTLSYNGADITATRQPAPMAVWAQMGLKRPTAWFFDLQIGLDRVYGLAQGYNRHWDGDVAEVIAYDRVLTDPERLQVEDYLRTKWALP